LKPRLAKWLHFCFTRSINSAHYVYCYHDCFDPNLSHIQEKMVSQSFLALRRNQLEKENIHNSFLYSLHCAEISTGNYYSALREDQLGILDIAILCCCHRHLPTHPPLLSV